MDSNLILGDIIVNNVNNNRLSIPSTYVIPVDTYIKDSPTITITVNDDFNPTNKQLTCLLNNEVFYPDIFWKEDSIELNLGVIPNKTTDKITIEYFINI